MAPKLEHCFTMRADLSREHTLQLGAIKAGPQRIIAPVSHGFLKGSGVEAEILPGGSDWLLVGAQRLSRKAH